MAPQVKTYSCTEFTAKVACSELSAPPPPANWTSQVNMGIYGRRLRRLLQTLSPSGSAASASAASAPAQATQQAPVATPVAVSHVGSASAPAPAPSSSTWNEWAPFPAGGATSGRGSGATSSAAAPQCQAYFRQISFLQSLTLTATLSGVNSSYDLTQAPCAAQYVTATAPVSVHTYNMDLYPGNDPTAFQYMAWCDTWPLHFETPAEQPLVIVRGEGDPYTAAGTC